MTDQTLRKDTPAGLLLLFLWPAFEPALPEPKKSAHPWRTGPAVQKGLSESRQIEQTYLNSQRGWNHLGRKRRG